MESEIEVVEIVPKNMYVPICITQTICVAVILIAVLIIKFFFGSSFSKLEKWCQSNIFEQTKITANFDEEPVDEV